MPASGREFDGEGWLVVRDVPAGGHDLEATFLPNVTFGAEATTGVADQPSGEIDQLYDVNEAVKTDDFSRCSEDTVAVYPTGCR